MKPVDALTALEGHNILSEQGAQEVCEALGVKLPGGLIMRWNGVKEAYERYGFFATSEGPCSGVDSLELSYAIVEQLGIDPAPGRAYVGKGFQAKANMRAIAQLLSSRGDA